MVKWKKGIRKKVDSTKSCIKNITRRIMERLEESCFYNSKIKLTNTQVPTKVREQSMRSYPPHKTTQIFFKSSQILCNLKFFWEVGRGLREYNRVLQVVAFVRDIFSCRLYSDWGRYVFFLGGGVWEAYDRCGLGWLGGRQGFWRGICILR